MIVKGHYVLREIAGDYILVPVGETALQFSGLITLNEVGAFLWKKLQSETTLQDLVESVFAEYDVDRETAEIDVKDFVNNLVTHGIMDCDIV